jgi:hypothetical protein
MDVGADCMVGDKNGENPFEAATKKGFKTLANKMKAFQERRKLLPPMNSLQKNIFWYSIMSLGNSFIYWELIGNIAVILFFFFLSGTSSFILGACLVGGMVFGMMRVLGPIFPGNEAKNPTWAAVVITTYVMSAYCYFGTIVERNNFVLWDINTFY